MLDGRVAVVTGTSSRLGTQFAKALDGAGARVVLASRRHDLDLTLSRTLPDAMAIECDVRNADDRAAPVEGALERHGRIDILVNNAGVAFAAPAEAEQIDRVRTLIETNPTAVFVLIDRAHVAAMSLGAAVAARHRDRMRSLSLHGGWHATDRFLQIVR